MRCVIKMFKTPYYSLKGVVASETPIASRIGSNILAMGGNSVDASVATSLTLAITIPHLGGLGGDFFALVMDENGNVSFINGSGYAPQKLTIELMVNRGFNTMPQRGPLSCVVPGMIDGLRVLWEKFGSMEWDKIVSIVIENLRDGFPITRSLARTLNNLRDTLMKDPGSRATYYAGYKEFRPGRIVNYKNMLKTLEEIKDDPRNFYEGDIARKVSEYVQEVGGVLEYDDFKEFRAFSDNPIYLKLENRTVYEMPPNTQGVSTLQLIKLMENMDLGKPKSSERIMKSLEMFKLVYWIRDNFVSDPRDMRISIEKMLSDEFLEEVKQKYTSKEEKYAKGDTTYFAIVDKEGILVSGVQSLFYPFGAAVTEPNYGITLNARASSFSLDRNHVNSLKPRKRPLHTLSAMIIDEEARALALGLSGGHFRPQLHAEIYANIFYYGLDIQEAIEHPRFIWHLWSNKIEIEEGYRVDRLSNYEAKVVPYPSRLGIAAAAEIINNKLRAGYCDIRGDGMPIGI